MPDEPNSAETTTSVPHDRDPAGSASDPASEADTPSSAAPEPHAHAKPVTKAHAKTAKTAKTAKGSKGSNDAKAAATAKPKTRSAKQPKPKATSPKGASQPSRRERTRSGRIAILGRPNVGKSTLLNALLGEPIAITSPRAQTTREAILGIHTEGPNQFVFVDTPGLHDAQHKLGARMNRAATDAAADADILLFMTDVGPEPKPTFRPEDRALLDALDRRKPTILVLNKVDRVKDKTKLFPVLESLSKEYDFAAIVPISARREDGRANVLAAIEGLLPEGPHLYDADSLSDRPVRFFVAEFVREQILRKTMEEVPHGVAVVVERFDESARVPHIDLAVHVDRESHKKIVIGKGGSLIKAIGTDARARVEQMLGRQVHLQIWVRVTPRWYEDEAALRDLGYGGTSES
jgi:GTP-binding protein Era